jgi:hypothetical protein
MFSPPRRLWTAAFSLLALTSLTPMSYAQNVTTWHNDNYRTGWQANESILSTTGPNAVNQSSFGLLWQWSVTGFVYAQPLAVTLQQSVGQSCPNPCSLVFVATEQNMLYAFNATSSSSTPVWSLNLGSPVVCGALPPGVDYDPCSTGVLGPYAGVTGTPVIDVAASPKTLYVTAATQSSTSISFYLFAVDITTGLVRGTPMPIAGMVSGESPDPDRKHFAGDCTSDYPGNGGQVTFEYHHIQRSALLLLNGIVYVAFSGGFGNKDGETTNGWIFGYSFANNTFSPTAVFNSTPYGTGGGIWGSGAGPASDGANIYAAIANGTLFDPITQQIPYDLGDSLVKLDPSNHLNVLDFYAPPDGGAARCLVDTDFGSGGVLLPPAPFTYNSMNVVINADKESKIYVANKGNLGKFNASGGNNIQTILTPHPKADGTQGYWASPAYWHYKDSQNQDHYMLYYSATTDDPEPSAPPPLPINEYSLLTSGASGPIPDPPTASTQTLFCQRSPTPSGSWNGTTADPTTGIVWAIERPNQDNPGNPPDCDTTKRISHAALHAFSATNLSAPELYSSRGLARVGPVTAFSTPTIFNGHVYVGTQTEVNVFGLCASQQGGCLH